ncbi:hypothetical protein BH09PAT2_BH09PAT2_04420 [soil metagenome]
MAQTVVSIFKYKEDIENAINELKDLHYDPKQMSLVMKDIQKAESIEESTGAKVSEGAASGAVTGGILAGLTGLLVGIGAITIPGLGALLVAGPIASALGLTGAVATTTTGAISGAVVGGLVGGLLSLGFPQEVAQKYEEEIKGGGMLLVVPSLNKRTDEVRNILEKHKAYDIRQMDLPAGTEKYR